MATNPNNLAYRAETLAKILTDVGLKMKDSEEGMDALIRAIQSLGIKSEEFLNVNSTAVERVGATIQRLEGQLQRAKNNNNFGEVFETEKSLKQQTDRQNYLSSGRYSGDDLLNSINSNISLFTKVGDSVANSVTKYIDFQAKIQTMQIDMIKNGWEAISSGQTPFMSKSLQITTDYTKEMIDLNAQQNKTITGTIASGIGNIIGGVAGFYASGGNPLGAGMGASMGSGLLNSITSTISEYMLAEQKKDIAERMQTSREIGLITSGQKDLQSQKLGIGSYLSINNQSTGGLGNTEGNLYDLWQKYAGVPGFDIKEMLPNIKQMGVSRQFGNNPESQINMASDINKLELVTGVGKQEIISYFSELRMKIGVPIDGLVDRFGELFNMSTNLQIPLKQVMSDMMDLSVANNKYLFTQNQLDTLYGSFSKEIKEGTVSVQDLKKVMDGMSQTPMDKMIGIQALIKSQSSEDIITQSGTQNPEAMRKYLGLLKGMTDPESALFGKMVSSPEADKNEYQLALMEKYGISQKDLKGMQFEPNKVGVGLSKMFAGTGAESGIQQLLFENFMNISGQPVDNDLFKQGKQIKAIESFGDSSKGFGGVTDKMKEMDDYIKKHKLPLVETEIKAQKELTTLIDIVNKRIFDGEKPFKVYGDNISKLTEIIYSKNKEIDEIVKKSKNEADKTTHNTELSWWDRYKNTSSMSKILGGGYINAFNLGGIDTKLDLSQYSDYAYDVSNKHGGVRNGTSSGDDKQGYSVHIYTKDGETFNINGIRTEQAMNELLNYVKSLSK